MLLKLFLLFVKKIAATSYKVQVSDTTMYHAYNIAWKIKTKALKLWDATADYFISIPFQIRLVPVYNPWHYVWLCRQHLQSGCVPMVCAGFCAIFYYTTK